MTQPKQHVHSALILEKARQDATGETAAGWWKWEIKQKTTGWQGIPEPQFHDVAEYRYSMTLRHPQYVPEKPILRLIDMAKLPKGTRLRKEGIELSYEVMIGSPPDGSVRALRYSAPARSFHLDVSTVRIAEQKEFTYWGGGECPLPQGLICEVIRRDGTKDITASGPVDGFWCHCRNDLDIIAYRILGVARGWTDNPNEATHGK